MFKISIITVNWWAKDFLKLLIKTVSDNSSGAVEIIVVDNSGELPEYKGKSIKVIKPERNLGHGKGLNLAVKEAKGKYILALDVDTHILLPNWDKSIIKVFESTDKKILAGEGGMLKPVRPCVMFFEKEFFLNNNMSFEAQELKGVKFDVGIHFYFRTLSLFPEKVELLRYAKTDYKDVLGNNYMLRNKPFVYHNWYGTRFYKHNGTEKPQVDSVKLEEFKFKKNNLFEQINE